MWGGGRLLLRERYEVQEDWMEGSGSCEAPNRHDCCHTITDNIWRAYVGCWYPPRIITNAASDVLTGKYSNVAGFRETSGRQSESISHAQCGAWLITDGDCEASSTRKHVPLHVASRANYHIEIGFGRRHCDGSCVTRGVDSQIGIFDPGSQANAIRVPSLLCVSFFWMSVTKLWDRIIRQCVRKGRTAHVNVIDYQSRWYTNNKLYMVLPVTVKW